ncbi:hypothetical protein GCM10028777_20250 [Angustibacter speluncae]
MSEPGDVSTRRGAPPVLVLTGSVVGLGLAVGLVPRVLRDPSASAVYAVSAGHHAIAAAVVVLAAAAVAPLALVAVRLGRRHRWALALLVAPVAAGLAVLGLTGGRGDAARVAASLEARVGVLDAGKVLTAAAAASLLSMVVSVTLAVLVGLWWDRRHPAPRRSGADLLRAAAGAVAPAERARARRRALVQGAVYALVWAVVLAVVVPTVPR